MLSAVLEGSDMAGIKEELDAARRQVQRIRTQRAAEEASNIAELENARHAKEAGDVAECSVCFDELPLNRQIHCEGVTPHFTCFDCATNYVSSEVGQSRCRVFCTAGCGAGFAPRQMNLLSDKPLLAKLADLEQQKAIRDAGLENLEECPFCDYKAEMPPIEENFEFRCLNPECEKVSCRRCRLTSHIPLSCKSYKESLAKDHQLNAIHTIEEAMTEALMRSCNRCKTRFIKDYGCNKMTCPSCSNLQCYVCSATLKNYDHFESGRPREQTNAKAATKKCPLFDNVEERHSNEVKEAEAVAKAKIMEEIPDIDPAALRIKMSDAVVQAELNRINRAEVNARGILPPRPNPVGFAGGMNRFPRPPGGAVLPEENLAAAMEGLRPQAERLRRLVQQGNFEEVGNANLREELNAARLHMAQQLQQQRRRQQPHLVNANPILANQLGYANMMDMQGQPRNELPGLLPRGLAAARYGALNENQRYALPIPMPFVRRPSTQDGPAGNVDLELATARMRHARGAALPDGMPIRLIPQAGPQERAPQVRHPGH
nr:isoform 2 of e3 ubiquitin-protein ligase [Quercus suber]